MTNGVYMVAALDEQGFFVAVSVYNSTAGAISGGYLLKGLRPGRYLLWALGAPPASNAYSYAQWYAGIDVDIDSILHSNRFKAPTGVGVITVGNGLASGVDFQFNITASAHGFFASKLPSSFRLEQNYPNPFNPTTTIRYALPKRSHVQLIVYNTLGQKIAALVNGGIDAGYHSIQFDASNLASGVYFYRLVAGSYVNTKKLLLIR